MKSLSNDTLEAIASSLSSVRQDHEKVVQQCVSLFTRIDTLPVNLKNSLAYKEDRIDPGTNDKTMRCFSAGSFSLVESKDTHTLRVVIFKRVGGKALAVFDSVYPEVSVESVTWKAIAWLDKTISSLEDK